MFVNAAESKNRMKKVFVEIEGCRAAINFMSSNTCPYSENTNEYRWWLDGWNTAKEGKLIK